MAIIFHTKVAQIVGEFLGYFGKWHYLSKSCRGYFWGNHWRNWAPFNSNIWSHWSTTHLFGLFFALSNDIVFLPQYSIKIGIGKFEHYQRETVLVTSTVPTSVASVTRFGEIWPLWRNVKIIWPLCMCLFIVWQNFEPTAPKF